MQQGNESGSSGPGVAYAATPTIVAIPPPSKEEGKDKEQQRPPAPERSPEDVGHENGTNGASSETTLNMNNTREHSVATLSSPWEFDDVQVCCASCSTEFTPLNRRHHCRYCGKIFCHPCSNQRALIPPSSIVLAPKGGKRVKSSQSKLQQQINQVSFSPDEDPDRMLTYVSSGGHRHSRQNQSQPQPQPQQQQQLEENINSDEQEMLYGKGLEERFKLAREPLRVCGACYAQLQPIQEELRSSNSNAMRFNQVDPTDVRRLFNSPLAFTLGHEVRKAAYTLNNLLPLPRRMGAVTAGPSNVFDDTGGFPSAPHHHAIAEDIQHCKEQCSTVSPNLSSMDGVKIPARLLEQAKGVAVLTVAKGGFGLAGVEFGTGLVVARLGDNTWSAPSAIGTAGLSWGALIGAQISDHVFLLMTDAAVELMFSNNGSLQLGADVGVALGPVGRALEADVGAAPGKVAPVYTYSFSKGLYAGVSLDGKVIVTRNRLNEKFYGKEVSGQDILQGTIPTPPAAQPLYEALTRCHVYANAEAGRRGGQTGVQQRMMYDNNNNNNNRMAQEYGEFPAPYPPANDDQHSFAGMSDLTSRRSG